MREELNQTQGKRGSGGFDRDHIVWHIPESICSPVGEKLYAMLFKKGTGRKTRLRFGSSLHYQRVLVMSLNRSVYQEQRRTVSTGRRDRINYAPCLGAWQSGRMRWS